MVHFSLVFVRDTPPPFMIYTGTSSSVNPSKHCGMKSVSGEVTKCDGIVTFTNAI